MESWHISAGVALVTALGAFFGMKFAIAETQRMVKALHVRLDKSEEDSRRAELQNHQRDLEQVRIGEQLKALKATQRFRQPPRGETE